MQNYKIEKILGQRGVYNAPQNPNLARERNFSRSLSKEFLIPTSQLVT